MNKHAKFRGDFVQNNKKYSENSQMEKFGYRGTSLKQE